MSNLLEQAIIDAEALKQAAYKSAEASLVITGMAGVGKTHLVKTTLSDMGLRESHEFVHFKGRATAAGSSGSSGTSGSSGSSGTSGVTGPQGPQGRQGVAGNTPPFPPVPV